MHYIYLTVASTYKAQEVAKVLIDAYNQSAKSAKIIYASGYSSINSYAPSKPNLILAIGGDGFLLQTIRTYLNEQIPFLGVNAGTVGYHLNDLNFSHLNTEQNHSPGAIKISDIWQLIFSYLASNSVSGITSSRAKTLNAMITTANNALHQSERNISTFFINDSTIFRATGQAARLKLQLNEIEYGTFSCDGILVATPFGSSAYNKSLGGPTLDIDTPQLSIVIIAPRSSKAESKILVDINTQIKIEALETDKRPTYCSIDGIDMLNTQSIIIHKCNEGFTLLKLHNL